MAKEAAWRLAVLLGLLGASLTRGFRFTSMFRRCGISVSPTGRRSGSYSNDRNGCSIKHRSPLDCDWREGKGDVIPTRFKMETDENLPIATGLPRPIRLEFVRPGPLAFEPIFTHTKLVPPLTLRDDEMLSEEGLAVPSIVDPTLPSTPKPDDHRNNNFTLNVSP
jgi:hypothetical protein